ncbi:hypothetical protein ABFS83_12G012400 [Erythranthe nasuta]
MSISLEALAMSGANFLEVGFDMNEWEQMESEVPPHLLADEEEENEEEEEEKKIEWNKVDHENRMKMEAIKKHSQRSIKRGFFSSSWSDCGFSTGHKARLDNCFRKLDGYLETVLDEHYNLESTRKGDDDEEDLVDALIRLSNQENGLMSPLSKEQIKAMLMNTFLGGVGTSSIVIVWAMCELMRKPSIMHKVQQEIRSNLGAKPKVEANDVSKFTYLKMIVKETLRLHPPVPLLIPRETTRTCQIRDETSGEIYDVHPKTRVLVNAWAIGRDRSFWKNPDEFDPERFDKNEVDYRGQHFEFVPFGGGRRICPGISNSIATIELTLANLLCWFDWRVADGVSVEDVAGLEEEGGVTVHKKTHLTLVPIKYIWK